MAAAARREDDDYDDDYDDDDAEYTENGRILSLESINDALAALTEKVERALSGPGAGRARRRPEPASSGRPSMAETAEERRREIREELAALKRQEQADAAQGEVMTRLGKVEKALERAPRQLRRIEERMGWHRG